MLDDLKYLDSKFAHLFPEHELLQIEYIALPIAKVEIQVIGQVVTETTPITEFLLKFVDLVINQVSNISEALGISEELALDEVAEEIRQGRIDRSMADRLVLTALGKETLISSTVRLPKKQKIEVVFDKGSWKLMEWDKSTFIPNAEFRDQYENTLKSFENKKSTIQLKDLDVVSLNRLLKSESKVNQKNTVEILNIQKITQRRHGYRLGRLMIYSKTSTENGFVVLVGDERSEEHENLIRLRGGLDSLNIKITAPVKVNNKQKTTAMQVMEVPIDVPYEDDGRLVKSFEHRPILLEALENSKHRFMIIAPWITRAVVDDDMIRKLERLIRSKVAVTIAFGFHDASNPHELKRRDDARILNKLLALSRRYSNFEFRWMGLTSDKGINHSKIFVSDSIYIAGSFNWLSFKGAADRTYRKEDSEMRTKKEVVDARYKSHHDEILKISVPMSEEFVPKDAPRSSSPESRNRYRK